MTEKASGVEPAAPRRDPATLAGKYMTFKVAQEEYGLAILKVRELIGSMDVTRVPGAPAFVKGVINLRGKVIPVVELRARFGIEEASSSHHRVIIVVEVARPSGTLVMGIFVDEVLEVRHISAGAIEPPPSFDAEGTGVEFILGLGKADKRVILLLDIDRVLSSAELARLPSGVRRSDSDAA